MNNTNVFVANIDYGVTVEELRNLFEKHANIRSCRIMINRETGRSRGYGFVECETHEEAEACIKELNGHIFNDRKIAVKWGK